MLLATGCRSNNGGLQWPWANRTPVASVPPGGNAPQVAANPANGPWQAYSPDTPIDRLRDLFQRENEQTRLAEEQRQALADLADFQRQQSEQLEALASDRQRERIAELQDQAAIMARQKQELEQLAALRRQALELDSNNQELHAQLAQTEQQNRVLEDQMQLLRQQLNDAAQQMHAALQSQRDTEQRVLAAQNDSQRKLAEVQQQAESRVSALQASMQRRGSATITANNSLRRTLTPVSIAGLVVRQDGDVIRIELPADRIFAAGTASLTQQGQGLIDQVAASIRQSYPQQIIGIEAHTDNSLVQGGSWRGQQLTANQSVAVLEQFAQRHQFPSQQMFVLGHGANYPVASNATQAGQQRNRRVEVVIYPETVGQR